jgi:hypothetical protein
VHVDEQWEFMKSLRGSDFFYSFSSSTALKKILIS